MNRFNSNKIKELRKLNHITQKKLGELLNISDRAISKWESDLSRPSGQNLLSLAKIFKVPVEYFFDTDADDRKRENKVYGMESLRELYKIGRGPSSSHTIGPEKACMILREKNKETQKFRAILYGSLAKTGKGHCTDEVIRKTFFPYPCDIQFNYIEDDIAHPNTMELIAYKDDVEIERVKVFSIGGGSIAFENDVVEKPERIYKLDKFSTISRYCEQNASGEKIVTAPTCGAAGIVPAVLYYQQQKNNFADEIIVRALMTAGVIGNLIKTNASISGAECGCQAEVGSACAMAAAALGELFELSLDKIEYASEIAIEHHLGLTCDPICGLVQIPCIERNAVAAMRAINAVNLASFLWNTRKISLDKVIQTMKETGIDMHRSYKETSEAGLARISI